MCVVACRRTVQYVSLDTIVIPNLAVNQRCMQNQKKLTTPPSSELERLTQELEGRRAGDAVRPPHRPLHQCTHLPKRLIAVDARVAEHLPQRLSANVEQRLAGQIGVSSPHVLLTLLQSLLFHPLAVNLSAFKKESGPSCA